jgi:hypothetical protein
MPLPSARHLVPPILVLSFAALSPAQSPVASGAPAARVLPPATAPATPHVDTMPDGTVWARGADWKASFGAHGVTFVPFLGSDAPRNFPLALQLAHASVGAEPLALDLQQRARVAGERVELDRGTCIEAYELRSAGVEQTFTFPRAVRGGALQVRMQVATELAVTTDGAGGWRFCNERGGVHYGRAIAIDAASRTTPVDSACDGQWLVLTVPAEFVATAAFPLTIDPWVSTFSVTPAPIALDQSNTDCAYLGTFFGLYAGVVEEHYSATDHDVLVTARDRDGLIVTSVYVDYTTDYWATPAIASHRGASQFLVVAAKGAPASVGRTIQGRTLTWNGGGVLAMSAQFPIQSFGNGMNPDVGGDPNPSPALPGNYCVTWEGTINGELYYNLVRTDTSLLATNGSWLDPGPEFVSNPAISKSCGVGATSTQEWVIVWQKRYSPTDEDIHGTRIAHNGTVLTLDFLIDYSGLSDTDPEVSSLTDTTGAGVERFAVVYTRDVPATPLTPAHSDVMGQAFAGTTSLSGTVNLTQLLNGSIFDNHYHPCIDTDGQRFALGFTQWGSIFSTDTEPYLATLHLVNGTFAVTSFPELLNAYHGPDERMRVTSERSGGTFSPRYMATWQTEHTTPPSGAGGLGAFYYGHSNIPPSSWFATTLPGCGTLQLAGSGRPALAQLFTLDLTGASGIPFLMFGNYLPTPFPVCASCILGVDSTTAIFVQTTSLPVFVPPNVGLIDQIFGAQGLDLFAPNGCTTPFTFTLSNTVLITVL